MTLAAQIIEQANALGPWHHRVRLRDGIFTQSETVQDESGAVVSVYDPDRSFEQGIRPVYPDGLGGRSFLDCACNAGGHSFAARDHGAGEIHGFDIREHWIRQARFIAETREGDMSNMRFDVASFDDLAASDGTYDITWFSGIFHHLPDPVAALRLVADRTRETLFLNTACVRFDPTMPEKPELVFRPQGTRQLLSGVSGVSWLPSGPQVLRRILNWMGFVDIRTYYWVQDEPEKLTGPPEGYTGRIALAAARSEGALGRMVDLKTPTSGIGPARPKAPAPKPEPAEETRPLRWEDDLSVHALDTAPFERVPPVAEWADDAFEMIRGGKAPSEIAQLPLIEMARRDTAPLPVRTDREGYSQDNHEHYWLSGLRDYHLTSQVVARHGGTVDRIMEIGCASGRVLRHFAFQSEATEIWGSDINHRHIRFLNTHMPAHVRAVAVPALPHYPVEDNHFDLVTAYSVFTHVDTFETAFLAELRRMLRPGGIAYLTVSDESHRDMLQQGTTETSRRLAERIAGTFPDGAELLKGPLTEEKRYLRHRQTGPYRGIVFTPQEQITTVWSRFFQIEEIIPSGHSDQTVVVARKPRS
ncbi:MAG: class I SAM-dependent methyltransferase [Rubellimicrobium sp.]|nr:class I SAM-dependent methyltransferase [Rubellimicrobium sp.]